MASENQKGLSWATDKPWRQESEKEYKIEFVVDSGATDSVAPTDFIPNRTPKPGAKFGMKYNTANGAQISNEGIIELKGKTSNTEPFEGTIQTAKITKPLAATIDMCDAGNFVFMTKTGGGSKRLSKENVDRILKIIKDAPGYSMPFERKGRRFVMEITVPKDQSEWEKPKKTFKKANIAKKEFVPTKIAKNTFNDIFGEPSEMDVDSLLIGQAVRG